MKAILNLQIKIFFILILILVVSGFYKDIKVLEISKNIFWYLSSPSLAESPLIIVINNKEYNSDRFLSKEEKLEILDDSINFTKSIKGVEISELPTKERNDLIHKFAGIKGRTLGKLTEKLPTETLMAVGVVDHYYIKQSTIYEKIIAFIILSVFINIIIFLLTLLIINRRKRRQI